MNVGNFMQLINEALYQIDIEQKRRKIEEYNDLALNHNEEFVQLCLTIIFDATDQFNDNLKDIVATLLNKNIRLINKKSSLVASPNSTQYYKSILAWLSLKIQQRQSLSHQIQILISNIINLYLVAQVDSSPFISIIQQYIVFDNQTYSNNLKQTKGFNQPTSKLTGLPLFDEICGVDFQYTHKYAQVIKEMIAQINTMHKSDQETYYFIKSLIFLGYQSKFAQMGVQFIDDDDLQNYFLCMIQALQTIKDQQLYQKSLNIITNYLQEQDNLQQMNINIILDMFKQITSVVTSINQQNDYTTRQVIVNLYFDGLQLFQIAYTSEQADKIPNDMLELFIHRIFNGFIILLNQQLIHEQIQQDYYEALIDRKLEYWDLIYIMETALENTIDERLIQIIQEFNDDLINQCREQFGGELTQYQYIKIIFTMSLYKVFQYKTTKEGEDQQIQASINMLQMYNAVDDCGKILIIANLVEILEYNNLQNVILAIIFALFNKTDVMMSPLYTSSPLLFQAWLHLFYFVLRLSHKYLKQEAVLEVAQVVDQLILKGLTYNNQFTQIYSIQLVYKCIKYGAFDINKHLDVQKIIQANYNTMSQQLMNKQELTCEQELLYQQIFKIMILYCENPNTEINSLIQFLNMSDDNNLLFLITKKIKSHASKYDIQGLKQLLYIFIDKKRQNMNNGQFFTKNDDLLSEVKYNTQQLKKESIINKNIYMLINQCATKQISDQELYQFVLTVLDIYFSKDGSVSNVQEFIHNQNLFLCILICVLCYEVSVYQLNNANKILNIIIENVNKIIINSNTNYFDMYEHVMKSLTLYVDIQSIIRCQININTGIQQEFNQQLIEFQNNISNLLENIIMLLVNCEIPYIKTFMEQLYQDQNKLDDVILQNIQPEYSDYYVFCKHIQRFINYSLVKQQNEQLIISILENNFTPTVSTIINSIFEYMFINQGDISNIMQIFEEAKDIIHKNYDLFINLYLQTSETNVGRLLMYIFSDKHHNLFEMSSILQQSDGDLLNSLLQAIQKPYQCIIALAYSLNYQFDAEIISKCLQWLSSQRFFEKDEQQMFISMFIITIQQIPQEFIQQFIDIINMKVNLQNLKPELQSKYQEIINAQKQAQN